MLPSKINLRATALRKKERPLTAPPSLEYAQLIAQRRACRVAENRQMEQSNNHFFNLKNSIELENAFQERQRMESNLRLGNVPAHIAHPIAAAMMAPVAMEVDAAAPAVADVDMGVGDKVAGRHELNHASTQYTTDERNRDTAEGVPGLDDYNAEEYVIAHLRKTPVFPLTIDAAALRSYNLKVKARNASYLLKHTRPWRNG